MAAHGGLLRPYFIKEEYAKVLKEYKVDNFGVMGNRILLNMIGFTKCEKAFVAFAKQPYQAYGALFVGKAKTRNQCASRQSCLHIVPIISSLSLF